MGLAWGARVLGRTGSGLAWGARVLGRTLLVWLGGPGSWAGPAYTINKLDSDKDVNIIRPRDLTVIRMLI